jgi:hypothetical protein
MEQGKDWGFHAGYLWQQLAQARRAFAMNAFRQVLLEAL